MVWQRPKNVQFPRDWLKFECEKTGQKFIVKDLTPDYYDIALGYMTNMFMKESAICKPLNIFEDPISRVQMQEKWLQIMRANVAIVCLTDDEKVSRVAGVHMTMIREKSTGNNKKVSTETQYSKFSKIVLELKNEGNLFEKFDEDHYLGSLGLFVVPEFRGLGIATQILKARIIMCKAFKLRGTATVFSTPGAQAAAKSAGYELLATRTREQVRHVMELEHTLAVMGVAVVIDSNT